MSSHSNREQTQPIYSEFITLGQLIKLLNLVSSGAEVKELLSMLKIRVNGDLESRRGRKLYPGDVIVIPGSPPVRITSKS